MVIKKFILKHEIISSLLLVALLGGTYGAMRVWGQDNGEGRQILAKVRRGDVTVTVSGTGQVAAQREVALASKTSGDLVYLNAKPGQPVAAGQLIAQVDTGDAAFELENAKLSYKELVTVDEDELRDAKDAVEDAEIDLTDAYQNARSTLASTATDLADIMADLDDLFSNYLSLSNRSSLGQAERDYIERAEKSYYATNKILREFLKTYRTVSNKTTDDEIENLTARASGVAAEVSQTAKYSKDAVVYLRDREEADQAAADEAYAAINAAVNTANAAAADVLAAKNTLLTGRKTLANAEIDLKDLEDGPDELETRAEELTLRQKEKTYSNYFIRAPWSGLIASVSASWGDNVSNGTAVATLISPQKVAEISLNEIDAAKIKVGQKVLLTFDALEDLEVEGRVLEIDLTGTVSQGVVNYNAKISFETKDDRIKPGMTASAEITVASREAALLVASSAIKQGNYIDVPAGEENGQVQRVTVNTGLSNEEVTEILSGLEEGQSYVVRTAASSENSSANPQNRPARQTPSLLGGAAGERTMRGNFR